MTSLLNTIPVPSGLAYLPYQEEGIRYLAAQRAYILADDPGLGKTIQTAGVINAEDDIRRVLVLCPAGLKLNWRDELARWLVRPRRVDVIEGADCCDLSRAEVVIASYDSVSLLSDALRGIHWDLAVYDEAHKLSNPKSLRTKYVLGGSFKAVIGGVRKRIKAQPIRSRKGLFLTGTPFDSKPVEAWPLLQAIDPKLSYKWFTKRFCGGRHLQFGTKRIWDDKGASNLSELSHWLRENYMLRRTKAEALPDLPPKTRKLVVLGHSKRSMPSSYQGIAAALEDDRNIPFEEMSGVRHDDAMEKVSYALDYIRDALGESHKIAVFAWHKDVMNALEASLTEAVGAEGIRCVRGGMGSSAKNDAVNAFQNRHEVRVFLGQIEAAGIGINLTAASREILIEIPWTVKDLNQVEDRLHRYGAKDNVLVEHLVMDGTLDALISKILIRKQNVFDKVLNSGAIEIKPPKQGEGIMASRTIEESINIIADALLRLADAQEKNLKVNEDQRNDWRALHSEKVTEASSAPDNSDEERNKLKARLTELGVEFKPRMATDTLKALLASAEKAAAEKAAAGAGAGTPPPSDIDKELGLGGAAATAPAPAKISLDDVRSALVAVNKKDGNSTRISLFLTTKGATKLSELKEADYADAVAWTKEALK